jgi:photosystem II stability/assembly factor-like uncharacterized protein
MKLLRIISIFIFLQFSIDANAQWSVKYVDETVNATYSNTIKFKNDSLGLLMGNNSTILKSVDAGETWSKINIDKIFGIRDFQFVGDSSVFAVGDVRNGSKLIKSLDNGNTWDSISTFPNEGQINSICFFDTLSGLAFGGNGIYRTSDSGNHWIMVWDLSQLGFTYGALAHSHFPTSLVGYVSGFGKGRIDGKNILSDYLLKTTDSGLSWDTVCMLKYSIISLDFLNANTGFIGTDSGIILKTTDGGHSWSEKVIADSPSEISAIHFISEKTGFATGSEFSMLSGGGGSDYSSSFFIFRTFDGGDNWKTFRSPGIPLNSIYFINDTTCFVSGRGSLIMKSNGIIDELPSNYPWHLVDDGSGVNDFDSNSLVKAFPIPTSGILNLQLENAYQNIQTVRLLSSSGQLIDIGKPNLSNENVQIDLSGLVSGLYFLQVSFPNKTEVVKVLKK